MSYEGLRRLVNEARKRGINRSVESVESEERGVTSLTSLTSQPELKDLPGGQQRLMGRLQTDQEWLNANDCRVLSWPLDPVLGIADKEDAATDAFFNVFNRFKHLEYMLRFAYDYNDCIHGPGQRCPDNSVVFCEACARLAE